MADGSSPLLPPRAETEFDWANPDYAPIYEARIERLDRLREDPGLLDAVHAYYRTHPVEFLSDWGMTSDPRNAEIGLPVVVPFVLFQRQREFIDWLFKKWQMRDDGLCEKSRDMGASWLCVGFAVWMWRYYPGAVIGFGSRKEEYVDKIGDPKSLFWKVRKFIELLPPELRPSTYNEKRDAPHMRIVNPINEAAIVGEAGDNIGRGNRTSIYFKDESAFYEHPELIDAALSQTSNCKIDLSSANGNGNPFYRKRHGGKIDVFTFHWRQDPRKDDAWYRKQTETLDPSIVAQEIDIDYNASVQDAWVPGELVAAAQRIGPADVQAIGEWVISVDAAHMGDDWSVIHRRRGRLNLPQIKRRKLDGPALAGVVIEEVRQLERMGVRVRSIVIELDGPGVSCYDSMRLTSYADRVVGLHTASRQADDRNWNLRALLWRSAREYLENAPVSISRQDTELKSTLCSLKHGYKDGLLLMQDKKQYKKEFGRSPDEADAFVLSFAPYTPQATGFEYPLGEDRL